MAVLTTLCYLEKDGAYLMMHRVKKKRDLNQGKWIGLGGHIEPGESPEECIVREVFEECGLQLVSYRLRGIITFSPQGDGTEYMFLYTADQFYGELTECKEGELEWVLKEQIYNLSLWQGDRLFLDLLRTREEFFSLKLSYQDDILVQAALDGRELELFDVLDKQGEPAGMLKERGMVHLEGDLHRTAHVWIVRKRPESEDEQDENSQAQNHKTGGWDILLQKRSKEKDSFPGCYDISSAGHVAARQGYLQTALRELFEELGIQAQAEELEEIGLHKSYMESSFYGKPFKNYELAMVYVYTGKVDAAALQLQETEVESVLWQDIEECLARIKTADKRYCIWEDELVMLLEYLTKGTSF